MTTGIVLAGGRSSRFGRDKLRVALSDGRPLLAHAIDPLQAVCATVVVVGGREGTAVETLPPGVLVVPDPEAYGGPVVGLLAALRALGLAADEVVLLAGGDMPSMRQEVLSLLAATLEAEKVIDCVRLALDLPPNGGSPAVLPCALRAGPAEAAARTALDQGDRRLRSLLDRLTTTSVASADWMSLDPRAATIRDIDRPTDLGVNGVAFDDPATLPGT